MKIVQFSTRRRVTVTMFVAAAVLFGWVSFDRLAVNLLPDITYPTLTVRTEYPGTAPGEVENLISKPIEEAVGVVNGVVRVSSASRPGNSDVMVEFDWGTNMDFASLDIREKLDLVNLPRDAEKPLLLRFDPSLDPIMRIGIYGNESLVALRLFAEDDIKQELEGLEGVAAIKVNGGLEEEINVEVNTGKLASLQIPITQVADRLSQENVNLAGGLLKDGEAEYIVRTLNQFRSVDEIQDIVIGWKNGAVITLKDVALVKRGHKERNIITKINGQESVEVAVYKEADANTATVAKQVRDKLEDLKLKSKELFPSVNMEVIFDQSRFIEQSISEVLNTAIYGGILAIFVLYLFLKNSRSTGIISLAIPISVVTTFFLMYLFDVSLNIMSLGGLALGIGMLVDNSIVVLESIQRYKDRGHSILESANLGASEVGKAVTASTLTTICVFAPIVFVEGIAGQLFRDQALTVTFSLLASLGVALTVIPMLSSVQLRSKANPDNESPPKLGAFLRSIQGLFLILGRGINAVLYPLHLIFDRAFGYARDQYPGLLRWALYNRTVVIICSACLLALSVYSIQLLGTELIPEMSQGELFVNVKLPVGTPLNATNERTEGMEKMIKELDGQIETIYTTVGSVGESGGSEERENIAQINVRLSREIDREGEEAIMNRLRHRFNQIPALEHKFSRPAYFSFKTPVEVEISGYNLKTLQELSKELSFRMSNISGLTDIKSSAESGNPEIQITFNRRKLASLGLDISTVSHIIRNKIQGEVPTELSMKDRKIDIRVRAKEEYRRNIDDIKRLTVNNSTTGVSVGQSTPSDAGSFEEKVVPIPLYAVADVKLERGPAEIRRVNQERTSLVSANLSGRDLGSVVEEIEEEIDRLYRKGIVPGDFSIFVGGQNKEMSESFESMQFAILLAVFLVYLIMASQFESLLHPLVIMFSIPFAIIGVVAALYITGGTVSVVVLIGVIMLAGIVVNNAIVLVDYTNHLYRDEGMSKMEAIIEAAKVRLRPILMTTSTTVLALLPMALGFGEGAEIRAPMAITVIGGLITSTLLTLILIPTVYSILEREAR